MTVELVVALVGTGTVSVVVNRVLDLLFGRGKRERVLAAEVKKWETEAVLKHGLALRLYVLCVEGGVEGVPVVPGLPGFD